VTYPNVARVGAVLLAGLSVLVLLDASSAGRRATPASYPSCGTYWNRNTPVTQTQRRVNACIVSAARTGRQARAVAVLTTIEGDPIASYLFVRGPKDVLVVTDSTRDRFGSGAWERLRCRALTVERGMLGWSGCRTLGAGKPPWLVPIRLRS
jgi:hypothetical protein